MTNQKIVAFGEIMQRLSPADGQTLANSGKFDAVYGGTESNVLVALSCMGFETSYLSVLPANSLGDAAVRHLSRYKVSTDLILRRGDTMGVYYIEPGFGNRPGTVIYSRRYAEITRITEADFDYDKIFKDCAIFHISGVSFALSETCRMVCFRLIREAKERKIPVSFDFNYRSKLWDTETAGEVFRQVIPYADIIFAAKKDFDVFLKTDLNSFLADEKNAFTYLLVRERNVKSAEIHTAGATIYHRTENGLETASSEMKDYPVLDRVGSGDAFDAGVLAAVLQQKKLEEIVKQGMELFGLKMTLPGDILSLTKRELDVLCTNEVKDTIR